MQKPPNALFIGRFQPFHKGHEKAVNYLMKKYKRIKIIIGSAQEKRTPANPFSAKERIAMLKKIANAHKEWKNKISFSLINDSPSDAKWATHVCKKFSRKKFAIFSDNLLVRKLLSNAGYCLDRSPLYARISWQGAKIRIKIRKGKNYAGEIPIPIRKWMKSKGEKIVKSSN